MSVLKKIRKFLTKEEDVITYILAFSFSTLLLGYALSSVFLGIYVAVQIAKWILGRSKIYFNGYLLLMIVFYSICLASYIWSHDRIETENGLKRLVMMLLIPIAFSVGPKMKKIRFERIMNIFTLVNAFMGTFFLSFAILRYVTTQQSSVFFYHDLVSVLDLNAIYVSVYFLLSYCYLLSKTIKTKIDYLGIFFFAALIIMLSSKTIFAMGVLLSILNIFKKRPLGHIKRHFKRLSLAMFLLITILLGNNLKDRILSEYQGDLKEVWQKQVFNRVYPWTGLSIRLLQIRILKDQLIEEQIFYSGFGLDASKKNLEERHKGFNTYFGYHKYNYHNQYAQTFSELGIFGLSVLLGILLCGFNLAFKQNSFFALSFYLVMTVVFLTESFLWVQRGLYFFVLLNSMIASFER